MTIERRLRIVDRIEISQRFKPDECVLLKGEGSQPVTITWADVVDDNTIKVTTIQHDDSPGYHPPIGISRDEYYSKEEINTLNLQDLHFLPGITRTVVWIP